MAVKLHGTKGNYARGTVKTLRLVALLSPRIPTATTAKEVLAGWAPMLSYYLHKLASSCPIECLSVIYILTFPMLSPLLMEGRGNACFSAASFPAAAVGETIVESIAVYVWSII